jgi:transposase
MLPRCDARKVAQALHVLDRFHVLQHMNKAVDEVRAQEARTLRV